MEIRLSSELNSPDSIPYFLWDEPMTVGELRRKLVASSEPERVRLLGKVLREARDTDVWKFITPSELLAVWDKVERHLGRRRPFWRFLIREWQELGLIG